MSCLLWYRGTTTLFTPQQKCVQQRSICSTLQLWQDDFLVKAVPPHLPIFRRESLNSKWVILYACRKHQGLLEKVIKAITRKRFLSFRPQLYHKPAKWTVEKKLKYKGSKTKGNQEVYVKFQDFPDQFNRWITRKQLAQDYYI